LDEQSILYLALALIHLQRTTSGSASSRLHTLVDLFFNSLNNIFIYIYCIVFSQIQIF